MPQEFKKWLKAKIPKKEAKAQQSVARIKSIRLRLSGTAPTGSALANSRVSTRNPHPKLHSIRYTNAFKDEHGNEDKRHFLQPHSPQAEGVQALADQAGGESVSPPKQPVKLTRNKQVLSVTPGLFNAMRASQCLDPKVISNMFMERQKSSEFLLCLILATLSRMFHLFMCSPTSEFVRSRFKQHVGI